MGILEHILIILFITVCVCIAICQLIDTFRPGDGSPEGYEIDWPRTCTLERVVYKPKPPKVIVVESKHDKETDTTTSVIIVPATINVSDLKIKVDNTVPPINQDLAKTRTDTPTTAEKTEKLRRFHEPNFDDITCREPRYEGMIGHEPNFNIDTYDEIVETVTVVKDVEPNYDSCDGHEPSYD